MCWVSLCFAGFLMIFDYVRLVCLCFSWGSCSQPVKVLQLHNGTTQLYTLLHVRPGMSGDINSYAASDQPLEIWKRKPGTVLDDMPTKVVCDLEYLTSLAFVFYCLLMLFSVNFRSSNISRARPSLTQLTARLPGRSQRHHISWMPATCFSLASRGDEVGFLGGHTHSVMQVL